MKALWKVASGSEALWVQVVRVKYLPRSLLWQSKRTYNCTVFWRSIMNLREKLLPLLSWNIGNGKQCLIYGEPWCSGAIQLKPIAGSSRKAKVEELKDPDSDNWDVGKLVNLFGYTDSMAIVSNVKPPKAEGGPDRLIFTPANNGSYSVKIAYSNLLKERDRAHDGSSTGIIFEKEVYNFIWKKGRIAPRIRLFIWKLIQNALPVGAVIKARTSNRDPACQTCANVEEDVVHMAFHCPLARSC